MVGQFEKISNKLIERFTVVLEDGRKLIMSKKQQIITTNIYGDQQESVDGLLIFEVSGGAKFLNKLNDDAYCISLNGEEFIARRE